MGDDVTTVAVCSQRNGTQASIALLGPLQADLSRIASLIVHTRSSQQNEDTAEVNNNKSRVFVCRDERVHSQLSSGPALVKITLNSRDQCGVASQLDSSHVIINYFSSSPPQHTTHPLFQASLLSSDLVTQWSSKYTPYVERKNRLKLNMAPPVQSSPVQIIDKEDTINDPFDHFLEKYFSNLYLLTTPLTFFTKGVFARLNSLCLNDTKFYESILSQFLISLDRFDQRHSISNNGLLNSSPLFEKEEIYRNHFISRSLNLVDLDIHSTDYQQTNRSLVSISNNFRVREIQLQIIILLELIHIAARDDIKLFKRVGVTKVKKKLVGRKRKITPIINGTAISIDDTITKPADLNYNQSLDLYLDKLAINDMLNGGGSSSNEQYTPKFINYIVVPFFEKKCPNTVRHMIKKIKGPSFKPANSKVTDKKKSTDKKAPDLQRTSSNIQKLEDIAELKNSLTHSNSDLQSLKRTSSFNAKSLSKREIDMSVPILESKPLKKSQSQIFSRVGKRMASITSTSTSMKITESYRQVDETPVKKNKIIDVINTPLDPQLAGKNSQTQVPGSVEGDHLVHDIGNQTILSSSPIVMRTPRNRPPRHQHVGPPVAALRSPIAILSSVMKPIDEDLNNNEFKEPLANPEFQSPVTVRKNVRRRLFAPSQQGRGHEQ